jgi:hypothetical protein
MICDTLASNSDVGRPPLAKVYIPPFASLWPQPTMTFKILIVGGGLSGLTLANGLLKNGSDLDIQVDVYERDAQDLNREGMF